MNKTRAANRRLAQWRLKWLIEHSAWHQPLWCIDPEDSGLRNRHLRVDANR